VHFADSDRAAEREIAQEYFETCDHDGNGWISFREASESLQLERGEYAIYDRDQDGRVSRPEFAARYRALLESTGAFRIPRPRGPEGGPPARDPQQLRNAFDQDADGALDSAEMDRLLRAYDREELALDVVLDKLDRDLSKKIEGSELDQLSRLIATGEELVPLETGASAPLSLKELFGKVELRGLGVDSAPEPPRIAGPIGHFSRLDLDGDGRIRLGDLQKLQSPLLLEVRASAVLATLDLDEDGGLSEQEFLLLLGARGD